MKSHWITHQGRRIFIADYSHFGADMAAALAEVDAADAVICARPEKSVLILVDTRDTVVSTETAAYMKKSTARTEKHIRKMAIIGATGVRRIIVSAITKISGQQATVFDDTEKALDWLAK
jgi:hypothetical protein